VTSIHPALAVERIREWTRSALEKDRARRAIPLPDKYAVEITFRDHAKAYSASFYPGVRQVDPRCVSFETASYFDVLRALAFLRRA
jgi:D-amino peptidase